VPVPLLLGGIVAGRIIGARGVPFALRFLSRRGFRGFRARQVLRPAAGLALTGGVAAGGTILGARFLNGNGGNGMAIPGQSLAPGRSLPRPPMRQGQVVTPGPVPVEFVKSWQACAAIFAIDSQGQRWVWRPKLGIWKRIRNTRNIVISGKDLRRAKRLVRISKRLNKMRTQLR